MAFWVDVDKGMAEPKLGVVKHRIVTQFSRTGRHKAPLEETTCAEGFAGTEYSNRFIFLQQLPGNRKPSGTFRSSPVFSLEHLFGQWSCNGQTTALIPCSSAGPGCLRSSTRMCVSSHGLTVSSHATFCSLLFHPSQSSYEGLPWIVPTALIGRIAHQKRDCQCSLYWKSTAEYTS